jgi:uncharacterized protein
MKSRSYRPGALLLAILSFVLLFSLSPNSASPVAASSTASVVISQVYGGGGNSGATYTHDFVELFNRGTTTVSLNGWSVQYASATGTGNFGSNPIVSLSGSLAPGQYYLVQLAGGSVGSALPTTPDATGTINMGAAAGKVALVSGTTSLGCNGGSTPCSAAQLERIIDLVGYGNANFYEGSGAAPGPSSGNNTTAVLRANGGCKDTDSNSADFTLVSPPAPRNTSSPLNLCEGPPQSTNPAGTGSANPSSVEAGSTTLLSVVVTPGANPASTALTVACDLTSIGGSATQQFVDDGTNGDVVAGDNTFSVQVVVATSTLPGNKILPCTIADEQDRTGSTTISLVIQTIPPQAACGDPRTRIHAIQGSGLTSPVVGSVVAVEAVVVGDYQRVGNNFNLRGFYLQERDEAVDSDPATSEGLFIFDDTFGVNVSAGDLVRVVGTVAEFASSGVSLTQLAQIQLVTVCGSGYSVTPAVVNLPVPSINHWERYEGMLVTFADEMTVTETFTLGRFGEVGLAAGGRLFTPTNVVAPGPEATALQGENNLRRILLDDGMTVQNPDPVIYPQGGLSASNPLRSGYTVPQLTGILDHRFGLYRVQPVGPVNFVVSNPRQPAPSPVGGNVRVAAFNVLNYFTTLDTGAPICGPTENMGCRGANSEFEFARQRAKIISAIATMDAHVVGLMELENNPGAAIQDLVNGLNAAAGYSRYQFINTGTIGTDAIRVGIIYQPARVTPAGAYALLDSSVDPRFDDTRNRPALAQTFALNTNGERFTVAVNHLKSKGSACSEDPDQGDGQGNCNGVRTRAAEALVDWLATDPTGSGDPDYMIIGDLNAYAMEDPIRTIEEGGYVNLIRDRLGLTAYSYVFDGQAGYLDHALATTSLAAQVTGVTEWHINADEPIVMDYNVEFKSPNQVESFYSPDAFRSSDHDPVIVGLSLVTVPTNRDQCRNGGWADFIRANGTTFKNQGQCVSYVNTGK